jgi:hypothetical protein
MILIRDVQQVDYCLNLVPRITWSSKLQLTVALLMIEVEYHALVDVGKR